MNPTTRQGDPEDGAHQPDEHLHQVQPPPQEPLEDVADGKPSPMKGVPLAPAPLPDRPV